MHADWFSASLQDYPQLCDMLLHHVDVDDACYLASCWPAPGLQFGRYNLHVWYCIQPHSLQASATLNDTGERPRNDKQWGFTWSHRSRRPRHPSQGVCGSRLAHSGPWPSRGEQQRCRTHAPTAAAPAASLRWPLAGALPRMGSDSAPGQLQGGTSHAQEVPVAICCR